MWSFHAPSVKISYCSSAKSLWRNHSTMSWAGVLTCRWVWVVVGLSWEISLTSVRWVDFRPRGLESSASRIARVAKELGQTSSKLRRKSVPAPRAGVSPERVSVDRALLPGGTMHLLNINGGPSGSTRVPRNSRIVPSGIDQQVPARRVGAQ